MAGWMQDVWYAIRQLPRAPGFRQTAVLLAAALPARRAASVEPRLCGPSRWRLGWQEMEAIRTEQRQ